MKVDGYGYIDKLEDKRTDRCRKWKLRVEVGINTKTGKPKQKTRNFTGKLTEAKDALVEFCEELQKNPQTVSRKSMTVRQMCDDWLRERVLTKQVAQETLDKNQTHINSWCYHFGKMPAKKLETYMITNAIEGLLKGDSPSGKPNSGTYIRSALITLNMVFCWGVKRGYARHNPVEDAPRPKDDTPEQRALSPEQYRTLIDSLDPKRIEDAIAMLASGAGYRRKEITLSQWKHIDLLGASALVPGTKTDASFAIVPLLDFVVEFLLEYKEWQRLMLLDADLEQDEDTYIITNTQTGDHYTPDAIGKLWVKRAAEIEIDEEDNTLEGFKLHELRHSFSTTLARSKVHPKVMQYMMRHKDERTTLGIYTHINIDDVRDGVKDIKI